MVPRVFIIATHNGGKMKEMESILLKAGCRCVSLAEEGIDIEVAEEGRTFFENAYAKAKAVYDRCKKPVIADDSGLCVDFLQGEPGVYTARYAGTHHDNEANIDKLLNNLKGVPLEARTARFVSCVCAIVDDKTLYTAYGVCEGYIGLERRGSGGFGYDPVFWQRGNRSIAEVSADRKNKISHRARAVKKIAFQLKGITKIRRRYDE